MPQVINETSAGGNLGAAFGQGLAGLLQNKMGQIAQENQTKKAAQFWKGLGLPDNLAQQFGSAPEAIQKSLLDRLEGVNIGGGQQPQGQLPSPQNMLSQLLQQPGTETGSQPQAPQTGLTIGANPAERRHKETQLQQLDLHNEAQASKYRKELEPKAENARDLISDAKIALEDLKSGQATTGILGRFTPEWLQGGKGQDLARRLNKLVLASAKTGKGIPGKFRLMAEQAAKGQLWHQPEVIEDFLNEFLTNPNNLKDIAREEAFNEILSSSEKPPSNIEQLVLKKLPKALEKLEMQDLPQDSYEDGTKVTNGDVIKLGKNKFVRKDSAWTKG